LLTHSAGLAGDAASVLLVLRLVIAAIFIRAGVAKLAGLADFRLAVANYDIVPPGLVRATAVAVPAVEVAAGGLLLFGILPGVVSALLAVLLVGFSAAIAVNLARGRKFDCGCDGTAPETISWRHVAANMLFAAVAVAIALFPTPALVLLAGPGGVYALGLPRGAELPVLLAAALAVVMASLVRVAPAARRLAGELTGPAQPHSAEPGRP
jgi:uncharacterized membrane protein YphA (DoxX/SURF4 family)